MGGSDAAVPRLDPNATVWRLRQDLVIRRSADPSRVVVQGAHGVLELHESELSVARMLDGRRQVSEVLDSAARLGIPVDVPGLARLVALLERHGCIARTDALAPDEGPRTTWPPRLVWDDGVRTLFQNAVRLMRLGALDEARGQLEALLQLDPNLEEAKDLLALVGQGRGLEAPPVGYPRDEPRRRLLGVSIAAGLMALALGGAALWLVLEHLRQPVAMNPLVTPGPAAWIASDTAPTPGGTTPTAVRMVPSLPAGAVVSATVERRWRPVLAEVRAPRAGRLEWERGTLATVARGERLGFVSGEGDDSPALLAARARVSELTRLAATDPIYADFLEREKAEVARHEAASRQVMVAASGGTLLQRARPGQVREGEVVAQIEDAEAWSVVATLEQSPPASAACAVVGGAARERAPCRITSTEAGHGRWRVQALVVEPAPWLAREEDADLQLGGSPR